jgi:hypothetical protein
LATLTAAPGLLITGGYDPLTSAGQRDAFRWASARNRLLEVAGAAISCTPTIR